MEENNKEQIMSKNLISNCYKTVAGSISPYANTTFSKAPPTVNYT